MAYVPAERAEPGTELEIDVRGTPRGGGRPRQTPLPPKESLVADPSYPEELLYHPEHDWARVDGEQATFGITWFAQDSLGEVVFFDPPKVGTTVTKDAAYTEIESVKAVSDVISPLSGEVVAVNDALGDSPETINEDPYGEGWLVKVKLSDPGEQEALLDAAAYEATLTLSRYTSATESDRGEMLRAIGVASIEELFADIPAHLRLTGAA